MGTWKSQGGGKRRAQLQLDRIAISEKEAAYTRKELGSKLEAQTLLAEQIRADTDKAIQSTADSVKDGPLCFPSLTQACSSISEDVTCLPAAVYVCIFVYI